MGGFQTACDVSGVEAAACGGGAEVLVGYFAAECCVLQVEEAGGALDVGHAFGWGGLQAGEHFAAGERPFKLTHELVKVVLHHAIKVNQAAVEIVEHFGFGFFRAQKK